MKKFLTTFFGSVDRPIIPIWIFLLTFLAGAVSAAFSQEVSFKIAKCGMITFFAVTIYNVVLLLIGKVRENEKKSN